MTSMDPATVEIIRSYLTSAAEEMRATLMRTAFNPIIYEVLDFGISIYDSKMQALASAPGLAIFISANDVSIEPTIEHVGVENLEPGDVVLMNYPYWNAGHVSDATILAPVFEPSSSLPAAYLCVRVHWADLGAKDPGYVVDSTDMFQEGLVFPGTKVYKRGQPNQEIIDLLRFNSRMPEIVLGDLHAQIATVRTGERRLHELFAKFGRETVEAAIEKVIESGERQARKKLLSLPQGSWTAVGYLDRDGIGDTPISDTPIRVQATVTNADGHLTISFDGSNGTVRGPINLPFGSTVAMCKVALKALTTPHEPANAGHMRPLTVIAEPGNLFHAVPPAPTFTQWTTFIGIEMIFRALSEGMPGHVQAGCSGGDGGGFMVIGHHPDTGALVALSTSEGGGWGAVDGHDGADALHHTLAATLRNTPIEVLESRTGLVVERLSIRQDSGGPGRFRGGVGVELAVRAVATGQMLSPTRTTTTEWVGVADGLGGPGSGNIVYAGSERERHMGAFRIDIEPGDRVITFSGGGGGHGDPRVRAREAVLEDVLDGYVSREAAATVYGQEIPADLLSDGDLGGLPLGVMD